MNKTHNLRYFLSEGVHSIFTHGLMSFAAVFMILACLLIMGSFSLVAVNLERQLGKLEEENEFLAFVDESYTREQAASLRDEIEAVPNVARVNFIPKEEAKAAFDKKHAGDSHAGLFADLPEEVYRDRYAIHVLDLRLLNETIAGVERVEGIAGYQAAPEVAEGFVLVRNVATAVATILAALLLLISLFIIYNTIKLGTFTRRGEIAIMKMCGATNGFVRAPFIFEGMILGVAGALIAFFCQWGIYELIQTAVDSGSTIQLIHVIPFREIWLRVLGAFSAMGFLVGALGSVLAIRKFLQV